MSCPFCNEPMQEIEISKAKWEVVPCNCPSARESRRENNARLKENLAKFINGGFEKILQMDKEELATVQSEERMTAMTKTARMSLIKHNISQVDIDMIEDFYLDDSKVKIPKSYFWKIKAENPSLCLSDFIDHIWKLQSEGIDPTDNNVKLVVYNGTRWIDGKPMRLRRCFTSFSYKYFIERATATGVYDGFEIIEGIGDYLHPATRAITKETFAKCIVHRKDRKVPINYTAWLPEFIKKDKEGSVVKKWREDSVSLLRKSAISNGHKQCFPKELDFAVDFDSMEI